MFVCVLHRGDSVFRLLRGLGEGVYSLKMHKCQFHSGNFGAKSHPISPRILSV